MTKYRCSEIEWDVDDVPVAIDAVDEVELPTELIVDVDEKEVVKGRYDEAELIGDALQDATGCFAFSFAYEKFVR